MCIRDRHVLSAVVDQSPTSGFMSFGPYQSLPRDRDLQVDFLMRTPGHATGQADMQVAMIDVYDATESQVLASRTLELIDFYEKDWWTSFRLDVSADAAKSGNQLEFRTHWFGNVSLDLSSVRVTMS